MPTIFDQITGALAQNDVSVHVSLQSQALTTVATTVSGLIEHPPQNLGDLSTALQALPLPTIGLPTDFTQTLGSLGQALPSDLSSITSGLTSGLDSLEGQIAGLAGPLGKVLEVVLAIYQATQVDLFCDPAAPPKPPAPPVPPPAPGGAPPAPPAVVTQLTSMLDLFPAPLTLDSLLNWLYVMLRDFDLSDLHIVQVPILDDLRDPLVTLMTWRNAVNPSDVVTQINGTLTLLQNTIAGSVDSMFVPVETALQAVNNQLPAADLAQIADQLTQHLGALRSAIQSGDLSATGADVTAINTLLDSYTPLRQNVQTTLSTPFATLNDRLGSLDLDLNDRMGQLVALLQPSSMLSFIPVPNPTSLASVGLGDFENWLGTLVDWLQELINRLDLSAIKDPLSTVAQAMHQAVDGLDNALVSVTLQVQSLFGNLQTLLNKLDPAALVAQLKAAIDQFQKTLADQLKSLFAPVQQAVSALIDNINQGVHSFNPADIVDALKDAIGKLAGVLKSPDVLSAMKAVRDALDSTTKALEAVSFKPLADQVIADIDKLTEAFQNLDTSTLSMTVQMALQAALVILPSDLTPVSDPLLAKLSQLIEEGPEPLLKVVEEQPKLLLNQVRAFEPGTLLGDALATPYQTLLRQMGAFKPSKLLDSADQELDTLKQRLSQNANPAQLFAPLEAPFDTLVSDFNKLQPSTLVQPLNTAIQDVIGKVLAALPVDATFQQVDAVLAQVQAVTGIGSDSVALLQRLLDMFNGLADPRKQMDQWIASILTNVGSIADTSSLQPTLTAIDTALDETSAAGLTTRFDTTAIQTLLTTLNPQPRLVALVQVYNAISRAQLQTLPDSPERAAILAALNRFNPVDPAFGTPYTQAAQLQAALTDAHTRFAAALADWDSRYQQGSALAELRGLQATPDNLRQWIGEALEAAAGRPLVSLLSLLAPMAEVLDSLLKKLQSLVNTLNGKLTELLSGPGSLGDIRDQINALIDRLKHFNLGFLTDSLDQIFNGLRDKLTAVSPAALGALVDAAFQQMLGTLQISLLIPADEIAKLDSDYQAIIDDLKALDPRKLVVDVVQPIFDQEIPPLLEVFDPSDLLKALDDRLAGVGDELRAEMGRVNDSYQKMRAAVPSISISLDISVDLPF